MPFDPDICFSHSNKNKLSEHLFYVGKAMYNLLPYNKDIAFLLGIFHDFGKITTFFQKYIQSKINKEALLDVPDELKTHSVLGVLFISFFFDKYLNDNKKIFLPIVLNCSFHHSNLSDIEDIFFNNKSVKDEDTINKQIRNLSERINLIEKIYKTEIIELIEKDSDKSLKNFVYIIKNVNFSSFLNYQVKPQYILKPIYQIYNTNIKDHGNAEIAFFNTILFGALINADRELADKLPEAYYNAYKKREIPDISSDIIEKFVIDKFGNNDEFKTLVFKTVDNQLKNEELMKFKIFNITAPTGSGKTETALNFAFKLKEKINADRVIYALPLTNIIEQNYDRLHDIFNIYLPYYKNEKCLDYLLKLHYLANYDNLIDETKKSLGEALKDAERLNSSVIITTYIQVLYAIVSNSPSYLCRLPLFNNSIILLDEPQVLKPEHWLMINYSLKILTDKFNCRVVLLTATKPLIFNESECYELTKNIDFNQYIKNRTKLIPMLHIDSCDKLERIVIEKSNLYKSILIVLNTIKSSIEFYKILQKNSNLNEFKIFYLSTNLIPMHRQEIINEVNKYLNEKEKIILVSTQVIEAGVEFDFDMGIRDLSTFDSIIQTAGRINRKGIKNQSPLFITKLIDEKADRSYASYIYNDNFLRFTENLLKMDIDEFDYRDLTENYFGKISLFMSDYNKDKNKKNIMYYYKMLQFKTLSEEFKIIEDDIFKIPILIPYDKDINNYINEYERTFLKFKNEQNYENKWELKRLLDYSKRKIIPYLVNVKKSTLNKIECYLTDENKSPLSWTRVINRESIGQCYKFDNESKIGYGIDLESEGGILFF